MCTGDRVQIVAVMCFCHTSLVNLNLIMKMEMRYIFFYSNTNHFQHRHWKWAKMKASSELERTGVETGAGSPDKWSWSVNEAWPCAAAVCAWGIDTLRTKMSGSEHHHFGSLAGLNSIYHNHSTTFLMRNSVFSDLSKKPPETEKKNNKQSKPLVCTLLRPEWQQAPPWICTAANKHPSHTFEVWNGADVGGVAAGDSGSFSSSVQSG